jgi:hypothetical protein
MHAPRWISSFALAIVVSACAMKVDYQSNVIPISGAPVLPPLADDAKVTVFATQAECKVPFTPIAMIHYTNPGKGHQLTSADAIAPLQSRARSVGANAVIIDHEEETASGIVSRGIDVTGRAVKIPE